MSDLSGDGRPDPATARDPSEFVDAMRRLKRWSGLGFRRLEQRARAAGNTLPRSTLTAALTRDTLPREDLVAVFARTCGCGTAEIERWVATRRRLAGRQADALGVYQQLRARLADELGIDPGPALRDLHTAILRNQAGAPKAAGAANATVVPRQLPAPARHFVGRNAELKDLTRLVDQAAAGGGPVVISAIAGTGGIGKTALALCWAHQVVGDFPDGQLYVNLRGFDPSGSPMTPAEAIRNLLDAFQLPVERIPVSVDAQTGLYRSLIAGRRMLVLLDNARDADQVRPLLPGTTGCVVLITSRNQLTGLIAAEGAHPITLGLLTRDEARDLLARHIGRERLAAEPAAVDALITQCARLPLALTIVAVRAAAHPTFPLATFTAQLADTQRRLDAINTGDRHTSLRAVFSWSYRQLSPAAQRLFRLLGLHPGPDIGAAAAASLAATPRADTWLNLAELTESNLLTEHTPNRYTFHDLLRAYATDQAHTEDTDAERQAAQRRILDHYLRSAHAAPQTVTRREPLALPEPTPGTTPENITEAAQAITWFATEHRALIAAIEQIGPGFDAYVWRLAWTLSAVLDRQGHWRDYASSLEIALAAARRDGDRHGEVMVGGQLGNAYTKLRRFDDAHAQLEQTLDLSRELGDLGAQANIHHVFEVLYNSQGCAAEALAHATKALAMYTAAGYRAGQAKAFNAVGWSYALLGKHEQALVHCERALPLLQELGDRYGQALTWDSLGYIHHHLGHYPQAVDCLQHAIGLFRDTGDRYYQANALTHLGDTHHASGDPAAARDSWRHALNILTQLDHPDAEQVQARLGRLDHHVRNLSTHS